MSFLHRALRYAAFKHNRLVRLYRFVCKPSNQEHATYLRLHGGLHSIGEEVSIGRNTQFLDPSYVRIGNNVGISNAVFVTHNAAVRIIERLYGIKIDAVGFIDVKDHVFIGAGAQINMNVTIGPRSVVANGSVVTKDVPPGEVWGGNPARRICSMEEMVERMRARSLAFPWHDIIESRNSAGVGIDASVEAELVARRAVHFWGQRAGDEAPALT